jgi:hypothetical protein
LFPLGGLRRRDRQTAGQEQQNAEDAVGAEGVTH